MESLTLKEHHKIVGNKILEAMTNLDVAYKNIKVLEIDAYPDYWTHLNELGKIKRELKSILNKDFDALAISRKK